MPDKLTDNEIVKAYEFCLNNNFCEGCIANKNSNVLDCLAKPQTILDLIHRLQAEVENYKSEIKILKDSNINLQELYQTEKERVAKAKQKIIDIAKALKTVKAEAYKECIKKAKEIAIQYSPELDNLLKEMEDCLKEMCKKEW